MMLSLIDRRFLQALRIRQDEDIAPEPESWVRDSLPLPGGPISEAQYIDAMIDPHSPRGAEGHPLVSSALYNLAHSNLRAVAVKLRSEAYTNGERCKCGALHPSACCYL